MIESKITTAGQTTIPASVRKYLGIQGGDKIRYYFDEGRVIVVSAKSSIRELAGILPKPDQPVSLEEIENSIAEAASQTMQTS